MTKKEVIMATEREALVKSHGFKTWVKKLVPLARQIQGKSVEEAILQMRFSKKKVAKDVMEHLEYAKNIAIVRHGMGLGKVNGTESKIQPVTITLKNGDSKTITDPSAIYIADSWVNRGPYDKEYDHRARGRINIMRPPHTGISVVLKEERTQIREWKDREARALRQRKSMLWVQLPNRPVSAQNQWYSW
jgi:ribosomal protein L22